METFGIFIAGMIVGIILKLLQYHSYFVIAFPPTIVERLERISENEGNISKVEVVRRACAVYEILTQENLVGAEIIVRHADDSEQVLDITSKESYEPF